MEQLDSWARAYSFSLICNGPSVHIVVSQNNRVVYESKDHKTPSEAIKGAGESLKADVAKKIEALKAELEKLQSMA